ncbi:hypothetical protein HPB52_023876 [Rhipicephalus sanguineus]|uniref:THAP-type domain-containing protein n=1 Tax=Rhipicephalus sanguineus TaxID=34632 RepID=A0A9D4PSZ8_RHISA|nr:hypothetical protein HPB52_023876 [Rhipicephalus sanguineus]
MRYCCVPRCTSSERQKEPGVTFHELPSDSAARERWITAIAREDSVPNTAFYYTVVCSLHFKPSDFRDDCKRRQLKPDAVPSVFSARRRARRNAALRRNRRIEEPKNASESLPQVCLACQFVEMSKTTNWWQKARQHLQLNNPLSYRYRKELLDKPAGNSQIVEAVYSPLNMKYIGTVTGEVGFNDLVRCRLETELQNLDTPQSKVCGLVVDEMRVREKLIYNKQRDAFVGDVDMGPELQHIGPNSEDEVLANSLLCFLLKTADIGFDIVRLVTDNHKVNVAAMDICARQGEHTGVAPCRSIKADFSLFRTEPHHQKCEVAVPGKGLWRRKADHIKSNVQSSNIIRRKAAASDSAQPLHACHRIQVSRPGCEHPEEPHGQTSAPRITGPDEASVAMVWRLIENRYPVCDDWRRSGFSSSVCGRQVSRHVRRGVRIARARSKMRAPCVVFIDEIDSVGAKRTNSVLHPYANQTITSC